MCASALFALYIECTRYIYQVQVVSVSLFSSICTIGQYSWNVDRWKNIMRDLSVVQ